MSPPSGSRRIGRRPGLRVAVWAAASVVLLTAAAEPAVAAQNASGRSSGVDVDLGVLDSLGPQATPDAKQAPGPKPSPARRGGTPSNAGQAPLPKPAAVPPPPKLPPPAMPAAKSAAKPEPPPPAAATAATPPPPPGTDNRSAPPPPTAAAPPATAALSPPPAGTTTARATATSAGRIAFASGDSTLSDDAKTQLAPLLAKLSSNDRLHVDLLGYAAGGNDQSQARRLSLARALAIRSYLVDQGIPSTRVDVRALGSRGETATAAGAGPADRVDIVLAERPTAP